jgi:hypothetical protein
MGARSSFEPHRGEIPTRRSSIGSQPADADGRHFASDPARTSRRYGRTATSTWILNQALRGYRDSCLMNVVAPSTG